MVVYASGKLMLFGEYLVLQDVPCLAAPVKFGQSLSVANLESDYFKWESLEKEDPWFHCVFSKSLDIVQATSPPKAQRLRRLLLLIQNERPELFRQTIYWKTEADFAMDWGLGSSSTLVSLLAQWSGLDPYFLLENSFGGSGYDIACATAKGLVLYTKASRQVKKISLNPEVTSQLLFIYSGRKKDTFSSVRQFAETSVTKTARAEMNEIVLAAASAKTISQWELLMENSEALLSRILKEQPLKERSFPDYPFAIKSLGAWGGDFFMATYRDEITARSFFENAGFPIMFSYAELIKERK